MPSIDKQVAASTDDCRLYWTGAAWVWTTDQPYEPQAGWYSAGYAKFGGGMRFTGVTIPDGAIITAAYLIITCSGGSDITTVNSVIVGEQSEAAATFSTEADFKARRGTIVGGADNTKITSASVNWNNIPAWVTDGEYNSADIKTIIQELVDDYSGLTDADIVLFWDDFGDNSDHNSNCRRMSYSHDQDSPKAPKLHIEYTTYTTETKTYTADALFKKLGLTETLDADTLLKKLGILQTLDVDALLQKGFTKTFLAKVIFGAANISEITADVLLKALGLTQTLDVDALLQQQDITQTVDVDAIIKLIATRSIDVDAILKVIKTATFTADVRLGEMGIEVFTASVYFKRLAFHVILDAQYITETHQVNRAYVIGRDAEGNPVHGTDLEQSEIDLVGERLDFQQLLSIPTSSLAADVADALLKKQRLGTHRGFITIPPNAGAELWDVIQVTDKLCAQSATKYRVLAITFDYQPRQHRYQHKLFLGAR